MENVRATQNHQINKKIIIKQYYNVYYSFDVVDNISVTCNNQINIFIAGVCLFLDEKGIGLEPYNCTNFTCGCPDSIYFMNNIYKCKIDL